MYSWHHSLWIFYASQGSLWRPLLYFLQWKPSHLPEDVNNYTPGSTHIAMDGKWTRIELMWVFNVEKMGIIQPAMLVCQREICQVSKMQSARDSELPRRIYDMPCSWEGPAAVGNSKWLWWANTNNETQRPSGSWTLQWKGPWTCMTQR